MKKLASVLLATVILAAFAAAACIFVRSNTIGDTNGDGLIDNKDVVALFRFVSGNKNAAIAENCDFNKDGDTDNKDVVALFRALSGGAVSVTETEEETDEPETETEPETEPITETETEEIPELSSELIICAPGTAKSDFRLVYDKNVDDPLTAEATMFLNLIKWHTGTTVANSSTTRITEKEIILSSRQRPETAEMISELAEGEYAVRVLRGANEGEGKLLIAVTTYESAYTCAEYLVENYCTDEKGFTVPFDLDIKGTEKKLELTESTITRKMRDPSVLVENGVYYVYSTGWKCSKNVGGVLQGPWKKLEIEVNMAHPETDGGSHWAPEVHKYNGSYYMFTTYYNSVTEHRGCIILKSDSPEGPFDEITDGFITPPDWDCIDGTFYIDPDGQLWMVFVHEWTCMPDGVGSFAAAKLSDDLTHFISEPIELFKANEPVWSAANVTDGCFMYTTQDGELLMLWSNFDAFGYSVAVAKSSNGRLDGEWTHEKTPLFSKYMTNGYDGGHAMVFTDTDGQMYIAFHSPNTATDDRKEIPVFLKIEEKDGTLKAVKN